MHRVPSRTLHHFSTKRSRNLLLRRTTFDFQDGIPVHKERMKDK
jgi:hypothetical protein